jgi:penicillin amidase
MKSRKILSLVLVSLFLIFSISFPAVSAAKTGDKPKNNQSVVIYRDTYGVPHIYAKDTYGLFYGYGYSIATDRLFQMEMAKRTVLGTVAEVLGAAYVTFDRGVHSNYTPASIQQQYDALDQGHKDIFEGYAAGINTRIAEVLADQANLLPKQFTDYGFLPTQWGAFDVVMIFVGTMCNRFSDFPVGLSNLTLLNNLKLVHTLDDAMKIFNQLQWVNDPGAPTTIPAGTKTSSKKNHKQAAKYDFNYQNYISQRATAEMDRASREKELLSSIGLGILAELAPTSNVWLLGKKKTYDGGSILQNGPQFGWWNPGYVYEVGLHGAGFDLVGNSPFGYPAILFGHNKHIAWGSTAGLGALVDIYQEQLNPSNPSQYLFNGQYLDMDKRTDTIYIKGGGQTTVDVYRTVHGFVISFDIPNGKAYSKKRTWEGHELESLIGWIDSTKAENYYQWRQAAEKMAITINWYYADRRGNIGYIHTGKYPIRQEDHDFRLPASGTGDMEWLGILRFDQNPQVYNPDQGYLTNWNNKPRSDWIGSSWGSADRVQVIIDEPEDKDKFTKEEAWDINKRISFIDLNIDYFLPFLEKAVQLPSATPQEIAAFQMLRDWDGYRRINPNNPTLYADPAQTIFQKWLGVMLEKTLKDDLGASWGGSYQATGYPATPPTGSTNIQQGTKVLYHALLGNESTIPNNYDFFNGVDPLEVVLSALADTITALTTQYGTNDMNTWLLPVVQQEFFPTNFTGVPQAGAGEALFLPISMNRGTENHLIVLKPSGIEGEDVCPPGQSGFVAPNGTPSLHYQDQMDLYKDFELKPMLFDFNSGPAKVLNY